MAKGSLGSHDGPKGKAVTAGSTLPLAVEKRSAPPGFDCTDK
jgi:hypothetical protein